MQTKLILNGRFEVTDTGEVCRIKNGVKVPVRITICTVHGREYGHFSYYENHKQKHIYHHKAIAEAFLLNPNNYPLVRFKDGDSLNVCVDNLEWCTPKQRANKDIGKCACGSRTRAERSICRKCENAKTQKIRKGIRQANKVLNIQQGLEGINESSLTPRQLEVVRIRRNGLTYEQIGKELGITRQGVGLLMKDALARGIELSQRL